ncbi:MAG: 2-C-methyl-D-erythritol 4-phosphate cytidylyltransferase [Candidatus Baltobacteraceae bacterium]
MSLRFAAIVVAAGRGERFGRPKQLVEVAGRPLVAWSIALFGSLPELADLVIATEGEYFEAMHRLAETYAARLTTAVVAGGATRQASVRNALAAVPERCDAVLVHDGARPLVRADDVRAGMAAVRPGAGALLATPVVDTIKVVPRPGRTVARTLERSELWAAQTPQFATLADLRRAHETALREGIEATDDAMLLERAGVEVSVVPSSGENLKVTLRGDRDLVEALLRERALTVEK